MTKITRHRRSRRKPNVHLSSLLARSIRHQESLEDTRRIDYQRNRSPNSTLQNTSDFNPPNVVNRLGISPPRMVSNDANDAEIGTTVALVDEDIRGHESAAHDGDVRGNEIAAVDETTVPPVSVNNDDDGYEKGQMNRKRRDSHALYDEPSQDDESEEEIEDAPYKQVLLDQMESEAMELNSGPSVNTSHPRDDIDEVLTDRERVLQDSHENGSSNVNRQLPSSFRPVPSSQDVSIASSFERMLQRKLQKATFMGIISIYGKARYTLEAYEHLVAMMKEYEILPSAPSMRQRVFPFLVKTCFVSSEKVTCPTKQEMKDEIQNQQVLDDLQTTSEAKKSNTRKAVVVLPSSWARLDIRCHHVLRGIVCLNECRCAPKEGSEDIRIETTARVQSKRSWERQPFSLWLSRKGLPFQATIGTRLQVHMFDDYDLPSSKPQLTNNFNLKRTTIKGERCQVFQATLFSTFMVDHFANSGIALTEGLTPSDKHSSNYVFMNSCIDYLTEESNRTREHPTSTSTTSSEDIDVETEENDPSPQSLSLTQNGTQTRKSSKEDDVDFDVSDVRLRPGDIVSFLVADETAQGRLMIVHVSRFWPSRIEKDRQLVIFLFHNESGGIDSFSVPTFGVPSFLAAPKRRTSDSDRNDGACYTTGRLSSGQKFYMYRMLLYADDFTARSQMFPRGSVGGVYMAPASLHMRSRRSQSSIRTISLTPPFVSSNYILDYVIDDLVKGCVHGFECVDAFGETVRCFLEVVGFIADYPASAAVVDVTGHMSFAPCTHCSFTFNKWLHASKYAYATSITSNNAIYRRTQMRSEAIRSAGLAKQSAKLLGMSEGDFEILRSAGICPLLKFCSVHNQRLQSAEGVINKQCHTLDGYNLNVIAPDHLITGLMKGVLLCTFIQLPDDDARLMVQFQLRECLLAFGFQGQAMFYKNMKLVPGLTMSTIYAMFVVFPVVLESHGYLSDLPTSSMISNLHKFIGIGFWWPHANSDGIEAWRFVHGTGKEEYHNTLHIVATNFVKSVNKYSKANQTLKKFVDRPNTHRLLELTSHTLPLYSHMYFFCELVFESSHQPLKFFLSRNHTSNSHLNSVLLILAKDWLVRIWCLWAIVKGNEDDTAKHAAMLGILRLLCGARFDVIDWSEPNVKNILTSMKEHVHAVMKGTVEQRLEKWYSEASFEYDVKGSWSAMGPLDLGQASLAQRYYLSGTLQVLQESLGLSPSRTSVYSAALFKRGYGSTSYNTHERLALGDVVQVLLHKEERSSQFITISTDGLGSPAFFVVGGILTVAQGTTWLAVKNCHTRPSTTSQIPNYDKPLWLKTVLPRFYEPQSKFHFLELTETVRKVGCVHHCGHFGRCEYNEKSNTITHSTSPLDGGHYFILPRFAAFPPRRS